MEFPRQTTTFLLYPHHQCSKHRGTAMNCGRWFVHAQKRCCLSIKWTNSRDKNGKDFRELFELWGSVRGVGIFGHRDDNSIGFSYTSVTVPNT